MSKKETKAYVVINEPSPGEFEESLNEYAAEGYEALHVCSHVDNTPGFVKVRFHAVMRKVSVSTFEDAQAEGADPYASESAEAAASAAGLTAEEIEGTAKDGKITVADVKAAKAKAKK